MNVTTASKPRTLLFYDLVPETLYEPELGEYHTYGVRLTTPECTRVVHDVSVCQATAEHMVRLFNQHQVSPVHLYDVITDLLP